MTLCCFLQEMLPQCLFTLHQRMLSSSTPYLFHLLILLSWSNGFLWFCLCRVTFKRVIRKKSTEEFSCIPYIIALMNSLLYTWYGLPIISNKWENFPLVTVNGVGVLFELSYILIYFWFSLPKAKASLFIFYHPLLRPCYFLHV